MFVSLLETRGGRWRGNLNGEPVLALRRPSALGGAHRPEDSVLDDREDVLLADDEELFLVDLELGPGVLRVQDGVALLDVDRLALPVIEGPARADRENGPLLGLLLGGVGQDDAALGHLFTGSRLDHDAIAQ